MNLSSVIIFIASSFISIYCTAQQLQNKLPVDTSVIRLSKQWPTVFGNGISDDGHFVFYVIKNQPAGSNTLVIKTSTGAEHQEFIGGAEDARFTPDSRWLIFGSGDSLCLFNLFSKKKTVIQNASMVEIFQKNERSCIAYQRLSNKEHDFVLRVLDNGEEKIVHGYTGYWINDNKSRLILQTNLVNNSSAKVSLQSVDLYADWESKTVWSAINTEVSDLRILDNFKTAFFISRGMGISANAFCLHEFDLSTGNDKLIWENATKPDKCVFDKQQNQLVFLNNDSLWFYTQQMNKVVMLTSNISLGIGGHIVGDKFSNNGGYIIVDSYTSNTLKRQSISTGSSLNIWSYKDRKLQPRQDTTSEIVNSCWSLNVYTKKLIKLYSDNEEQIGFAGKYVLLKRKRIGETEWYWQDSKMGTISLVSLENGERRILPIDDRYGAPIIRASPDGNYIFYFDPQSKNYLSLEIATGKIINITMSIKTSWRYPDMRNSEPSPFFGQDPSPKGVAGNIEDDFLVYDSYDIWRLDPSGKKRPENITNGVGRKNKIEFSIYASNLDPKKELIINAFNTITEYHGFYKKNLGTNGAPIPLMIAPCTYPSLTKAKNAKVWILSCQTPLERSRLDVTRDFKTFKNLISLQPQKNYNWFSKELVRWKLPDGTTCDGTLFKPEDFDSTKKYPVLFNYYEAASGGLFSYEEPQLLGHANINVPYLVSQGYLVFKPSIYYKIGYPGPSALACIESGARYLMKRSYVDKERMGLVGHSWGGFETNYVITHNRLFAAATEGAGGAADPLSEYLSIDLRGLSNTFFFETAQARIGATPWQRPDLYFKNSAVLTADKVNTPLLMLQNKLDETPTTWAEGIKMFIALRRLQKPCWMLEYDGETHSNDKPENVKDYTIRLNQFFDHYLKGEPAPKWMTEGIPIYLKGVETGYELDPSGKCGKDCKVCKKWNAAFAAGKVKKDGDKYVIKNE